MMHTGMHNVCKITITDVQVSEHARWRDVVLTDSRGDTYVVTAFVPHGGEQAVEYTTGEQAIEVGGEK